MILDSVWMVVGPNNNVIYQVGTSAKEVWQKIIDEETMGTGITKDYLRKRGYRAKKVNIVLEDK